MPKLAAVCLSAAILFSGCFSASAEGPKEPVIPADGSVTSSKFAAGLAPIQAVEALPEPGEQGRVVFLKEDSKLYRDTGQGWTSKVTALDLEGQLQTGQIADGSVTIQKLADGSITASKFAANVRPIELVDKLPSVGEKGRVILHTGENKLYIDNGKAWTSVMQVATLGPTSGGGGGGGESPAPTPTTTSTLLDGSVTLPKFAPGLRPIEILESLPASGTAGRMVFNTNTSQMYFDNGTAWNPIIGVEGANVTVQLPVDSNQLVDASITTIKLADGSVTVEKFAAAIRPIELFEALPAAGTHGRVAFLLTEDRLYLDNGTAWNPVSGSSSTTMIEGNATAEVPIETHELADAAVTAIKLADGSVVLAKLEDGTFTADAAGRAKFSSGFIDAVLLMDGAVTSAKIQDGGVTVADLADGAVSSAKLADGSIVLSKIANGTFTADADGRAKFGAGFVDSGLLQDGSVTAQKLDAAIGYVRVLDALPAAGQQGRVVFLTSDNKLYRDTGAGWSSKVDAADVEGLDVELANESVEARHLFDAVITAAKIANGSVETRHLVDAVITAAKLADGSVNTQHLVNAAVTAAQLADGSVDARHLIDAAITAAKLANGSVATHHLVDGSVTLAKLDSEIGFVEVRDDLPSSAPQGRLVYLTTDDKVYRRTASAWTTSVAVEDLDGLIQSGQLANASVTQEKIADGAIALAKLPDAVFTADPAGQAKFAAGFISSALLGDGVVSAVKLADGSVLLAKLPDQVFTADAAGRAKFAAGLVDTGLLADASVQTAKLADAAVTAAKLADGSVTLVKIADASFTADAAGRAKMAPGFVNESLLAAQSVTPEKLDPRIGYISTVSALPAAGVQGRIVFLTTDNKLYRDSGSDWIASVDAVEVSAAAWNSNNDGAGSGLDADRLDGLDSSNFLRKDMYQTFTGSFLTVNGQLNVHGVLAVNNTVTAKEVWSGPQTPLTWQFPTTWTDGGKTYTVEKTGINRYHAYFRVTSPGGITWEQGRTQARWFGGYLATVTSADEMTFIQNNVLGGTATGCRIGLTDGHQEGSFAWVTGELDVNGEGTRYSNWAPNEPNNSNSAQDTAYIYNTGQPNQYKWDDEGAGFAAGCALFEVTMMGIGG